MPLQKGRYAAVSERWLLNGKPASFLRESLNRFEVVSDVAAMLVTQVMTHVAIPVQVGDVITSISFVSGATAANTPTNWWFALYTSVATPALVAQTADQTSGAWAADTMKTLALTSSYSVTADGFVYAACMVKATTVPSLIGVTLARAAVSTGPVTGQVRLAGNSGAALTTTAPATIATPTAQASVPYCVLT